MDKLSLKVERLTCVRSHELLGRSTGGSDAASLRILDVNTTFQVPFYSNYGPEYNPVPPQKKK